MISEKDFKRWRIAAIVFSGLGVLLVVVFIFLYFLHFHGNPSRHLKDWADFGSFFGGTVGVIFSGLNFLIIAYLTVKIYRKADQQWLTQLRAPFYQNILERLNSFTENSSPQHLRDAKEWLEDLDLEIVLFLVMRVNYLWQTRKRKYLLML